MPTDYPEVSYRQCAHCTGLVPDSRLAELPLSFQARRVGQISLARSGSTSQGGKTGAGNENGVRVTDPAIGSMFPVSRYAALAFFAATVRG